MIERNSAGGSGPTSSHAVEVEDLDIEIDGVHWHYQAAGSGAPILLIHGLLGYSFSWRHLMPVLARHRRVFAVDLPGAGFSDRPANLDCTLRASAERVLKFLDRVGVEECDLLGTSHGGGVAMFAAALAPSRFRRLVLVAPINPWSGRGTFLSVVLSKPPFASTIVNFAPGVPLLHDFYLRRLFGDTRRMQPGTAEGYTEPLRHPRAFDYPMRILRSWNSDLRGLRSRLYKIADIPTLLLWGSLDGAVYASSATRLAQEFRDAQVVTLDGVGHLPYEEVPDEFNRAVEAFLLKSPSRR